MAIYRKEWSKPGTPWSYRLDIVPYDTNLDDTVINLDGTKVGLIEVGALETKFDGLPYGLQAPPALTLKIAFSTLPTALQTALRLKYDNGGPGGKERRNTFILYSNRGLSGTAAVFPDYAGTPAKIAGNTYNYEAGEWLTEIELIDCFYVAALNTPMSVLNGMPMQAPRLSRFADIPDYRDIGIDSVSIHYLTGEWDTGFTSGFHIDSFERVVNWAFQAISSTMNVMFSHHTTQAADTADRGQNAGQMIGRTVGYFTSTSSYPRLKNVLLNSTTAKVVTHVVAWNGNGAFVAVGGLCAPQDEAGWAKYENAWDWYKDLCEAMFAKASYSPNVLTFGTSPAKKFLFYDWEIHPVRSHGFGTLNIDGNRALEMPEIAETEDGIGKAETRVTTFQDADVKEFKVNAGVMRADKQFTAQPIVHNMPVMPSTDSETDDTRDWIHYFSPGLYQTNRFCTKLTNANEAELVHTTVRVYDAPGSYTDYEALVGGVDQGAWIPRVADDDVAYQNLTLYLNSVQSAGCTPTVIAKHLVSIFGSDDVASVSILFRLTDVPALNDPATLGAICNITSTSFTAAFPHLSWDEAILNGLEYDHMANTVKAQFILLP